MVNAARKYDVQKWFSPSDYPDIADEAFAKCYEHLERYQGLGRFRNWVLGYAKNIMRNRWRKQCTARRNQSLLESLATSQLRHLDPLLLLVRLERNRYLWDAFYRLTALEQRIVYQCVFCGTPPRTLARAFHLTRKQVLQHYEDARVKLRWNYLRLYR